MLALGSLLALLLVIGGGQVSAQEQCVQDMTRFFTALQQFPAKLPTNPDDISAVLLSGKGPNQIGEQTLCRLNPNMHFIAARAQVGYMGFCIYKSCTVAMLNELAPTLGLPLQFFDESDNERHKTDLKPGYIATVIILGLITACGLIGILAEYSSFLDRPEGRTLPIPSARNDKQLVQSKSKLGLFFLAFSFTRNARNIFRIGGGGAGYDPNLQVFAGVRTMSMMYVILGHVLQNFAFAGRNVASVFEDAGSWFGVFAQGGEFAVDVFFCMAAFLATYVMLGKPAKADGFCCNVLLTYFHRWYRLVPALGLVTLIVMFIFPSLMSGFLAAGFYQTQVETICTEYWWGNFLFINNFYPWGKGYCIGQVWYLANDFQFFLITPFLLFIMQRSRLLGWLTNFAILLLSIFSGLIITYHFNLLMPSPNDDWQTQYYSKPYCRVAAYMIGIMLAQLYFDRKRGKQGHHEAQNTTGYQCFRAYQESGACAWFSALFGVSLTTFIIFFYKNAFPPGSWGIAPSMFWNAMSRPLYVLGMMLTLLPTFEGRLPWLRNFMSVGLFQVVGKLTYTAYLIHIAIIFAFIFQGQSTRVYSRDEVAFYYFGIYGISYLVAFLLSLYSEWPALNIEKTLLFPQKQKQKQQTADKKKQLLTEDEELVREDKSQVNALDTVGSYDAGQSAYKRN